MSTDTPRHTDRNADHPDPELPTATVLIIEDNPGNRELAEQMLDVARYLYLSTTNVEDGWRLLQRGGVDLVLTDLHVNAFALIERMRANPQTTDIPVVVASGSRGREVQQAAIEAGATYYLVKPFGYDELISTVKRCLTGKEA
jgi:CheY-like chemotaxis protein